MKKGEKLFVVDLETVSLFSNTDMKRILGDENLYQNTPFLYLIASYSRNKSLYWAYSNLKYQAKIKKGSWMIYSFKKV